MFDPDEPPEPLPSANAVGIDATAEPTPNAPANAPTRPTYNDLRPPPLRTRSQDTEDGLTPEEESMPPTLHRRAHLPRPIAPTMEGCDQLCTTRGLTVEGPQPPATG